MLQSYFNQFKKRGTSTTGLLEEKERILSSLATVSNEAASPSDSPSASHGGFIVLQTKNPSASPSTINPLANLSGVAFSFDVGIWSLITEQVLKPLATTQAIITQPKVKSQNALAAYDLVKKSFENYKKNREQYNLRRQQEVMSYIDDDE